MVMRRRRGPAVVMAVLSHRQNLPVHVSKNGDAHGGALLMFFHRARVAGVERSGGARYHRSGG
jgi:hypothetical protein